MEPGTARPEVRSVISRASRSRQYRDDGRDAISLYCKLLASKLKSAGRGDSAELNDPPRPSI